MRILLGTVGFMVVGFLDFIPTGEVFGGMKFGIGDGIG